MRKTLKEWRNFFWQLVAYKDINSKARICVYEIVEEKLHITT
jgi:hypothetical protein